LAQTSSSPTISLRDRSFSPLGSQERLGKWFVFSLLFHFLLIAAIFLSPMAPDSRQPMPVYVVDLVGGERIGATNLGTELAPIQKQPAKIQQNLPKEVPESKKEIKKKEEPQKEEKTKTKVERKAPEEKVALKEKTKPEPVKPESAKEARREVKEEAGSEAASADSVRERLIQSAVDRAKNRTEAAQKSAKAEVLSAGSGEGDGAAGLGNGGRGSPTGVVKGMDFIIYQNRMLATIKENWAWVGQQRSNLRVVVQFGIKENGEIVGLRIVQPSGDPSYDESVLRALKKSNPLPAPPENYRKDFADLEISFRPRDLGA
jgi:colicin import membrane protein